MSALLERISITHPIIQAPMVGTSTPALAAAVSNAGGLGSIAIGASEPGDAAKMIAETRLATSGPVNVNLFCHEPAKADPQKERVWLAELASEFAHFGASPPNTITEIYRSFVEDDEMLAMLIEQRPSVISFHFGLPSTERISALRETGAVLLATATNLEEARKVECAGIDAIVAQGIEAGGHRGIFDPAGEDPCLGTLVLTRVLAREFALPVVAAGGIMDGAGIAAALSLGAAATQLGTAFIACPESQADDAHKDALFRPVAPQTVMTNIISGRNARCLTNRFTALEELLSDTPLPDYPIAYDAGKALNAAAKAAGESGYGAQWAGQGASLARKLPAADIIAALMEELKYTQR